MGVLGQLCYLLHQGRRINCTGKAVQNIGKERVKVGTAVSQEGDSGPTSQVEVVGAERAWLGINEERRGRYF